MKSFPIEHVQWRPSHRLVSSRFPPVGLFDRVSRPEHLEAVAELEGTTNPRLRQAAGDISLVPPAERVAGPGTTPIMAAFTHVHPSGSRFSDGTFGAYYCALSLETAIRETVHHRERFLTLSNEAPQMVEMRLYLADLDAQMTRLDQHGAGPLLHPDRYSSSQAFGIELRESGSSGVVYPSVRHEDGTCAAVFRPTCLRPARPSRHFGYRWDGRQITEVIELRESGYQPH